MINALVMARLNFYNNPDLVDHTTPEEQLAWLLEELAILDGWYDELGDFGKALRQKFKAANPATILSPGDVLAGYTSYNYRGEFPNKIEYNMRGLKNRLQLFTMKTHEEIHALDALLLPIYHATAFNRQTNILLCPRHVMWLCILRELTAYSGSIITSDAFTGMRCQEGDSTTNPDFCADHFKALGPTSIGMFFKPRDLRDRFAKAALNHFYREDFFRDYKLHLMARARDLIDKKITFVRLAPADIIAIGNTTGHSFFTDPEGEILPFCAKQPGLRPHDWHRMKYLNLLCSIEDERDLPTLREALAAQNISEAAFIARGRAGTPAKLAA